MSIFKKTTAEHLQERKFVGVNLPLQNFSYLTLYGMTNNSAKSSIMSAIYVKWELEEKERTSLDFLEEQIAKKAIAVCNASKPSQGRINVFREKLRIELYKKGIIKTSVINILTLFDNETK